MGFIFLVLEFLTWFANPFEQKYDLLKQCSKMNLKNILTRLDVKIQKQSIILKTNDQIFYNE